MSKSVKGPGRVHRNGDVEELAKAALSPVTPSTPVRSIGGGASREDSTFARQRAQSVDPAQTIGVSGIASFSGQLSTNERDGDLVGLQKWRTWDEILANVEIVSLGASYSLDLVSKPAWTMEPADDSPEAADVAELVEDVIGDLATPWNRIIRKAAMYVFRGFSVFEWTAKRRDDGRIGILDVEHRPQSTIEKWDLDPFGTVRGVVQRSPHDSTERYLPRGKILHFVDDTFADTPEGVGIFRCITKAARTLERYTQLEGFGFEGDLRGIPIVKAPLAELNERMANHEAGYAPTDVSVQIQHGRDFLENHVRNLALGFMHDSSTYTANDISKTPSGTPKWALEILQGGSTSQEAVGRAIDRITTNIARRMGIEHLMMGGNSSGTYSASKDKSLNFALRWDSSLVEMRHTIQIDLVRVILLLNGIDLALMPKPKTDKLQWRELADLAAFVRDRTVAGAPIMPGDDIDNALLEVAGLPKVTPEQVAMLDEQAAIDASLRPDKATKKPATEDGSDGEVPAAPKDKGADGSRGTAKKKGV